MWLFTPASFPLAAHFSRFVQGTGESAFSAFSRSHVLRYDWVANKIVSCLTPPTAPLPSPTAAYCFSYAIKKKKTKNKTLIETRISPPQACKFDSWKAPVCKVKKL